MSIRPIVQMTSPQDTATRTRLSTGTHEVSDFGPETQALIDDLLDTMAHHKIAIGLAAPQIGSDARIAVIDLKADPAGMPLVLVNPRILRTSGKKDVKKESCMSVPHFRGSVERRSNVRLEYQDRFGVKQELAASGFLARVVAHEMDHLDSMLYLDRMAASAKLESVDFFGDSAPPALT